MSLLPFWGSEVNENIPFFCFCHERSQVRVGGLEDPFFVFVSCFELFLQHITYIRLAMTCVFVLLV